MHTISEDSLYNNTDNQSNKQERIIFLDFDDCIIPWGNLSKNKLDFSEILARTEKNINVLNSVCKKYNFNIFITSSWAAILEFDENNKLRFKKDYLYQADEEMGPLLKIINKLNYIKYLDTFNNREKAIIEFYRNNKNVFGIAIDDFYLGHLENELNNFYYLEAWDIKSIDLLNKLERIINEKFHK